MSKAVLILAGAASIMMVSCSKGNGSEQETSTWKEVSHYMSPGTAEVNWMPTDAAQAEVIQFKDDNVFYSSQHPQFNRYRFESGATGSSHNYLKVYAAGSSDTSTWFVKQVSENTLELGYPCIEGCGKKFMRVHDGK